MAVTELNFDNINFALTSLGKDMRPAKLLLPFIGPPIHGTFQSLLDTDDPAAVEKAVGLYRQRLGAEGIHENAAYPGVTEMLGEFRKAGKTLFVATAKPLTFAIPILKNCGLDGCFAGIYGSELVRTNTPKAELIRAILTEHAVSAASAVMVGDRRHNIEGARESGLCGSPKKLYRKSIGIESLSGD